MAGQGSQFWTPRFSPLPSTSTEQPLLSLPPTGRRSLSLLCSLPPWQRLGCSLHGRWAGSQLSWRPSAHCQYDVWATPPLPRKGEHLQASDLAEGVAGALPVLCTGARVKGACPSSRDDGQTQPRTSARPWLGNLAWKGHLCPSLPTPSAPQYVPWRQTCWKHREGGDFHGRQAAEASAARSHGLETPGAKKKFDRDLSSQSQQTAKYRKTERSVAATTGPLGPPWCGQSLCP